MVNLHICREALKMSLILPAKLQLLALHDLLYRGLLGIQGMELFMLL